MATILETYQNQRTAFINLLAVSKPKVTMEELHAFFELNYRVQVIETLQFYYLAAPVSDDTNLLYGHYQEFDVFVHALLQERRYGTDYKNLMEQNNAMSEKVSAIIKGYRKHFSSYKPGNPEWFKKEILRQINNLLPAWIGYRNTFTNLNKSNMKEDSQ